MQHDWFGPTITLAVVLLFLVFGIVAMRRMAARRRADFSEVTPPEGLKPPAPRPEPGVPGVPAARVGTLDAPVAKQADEEAAEYEEKDAAPPAVARPARPTEVPDEALKAGLAKTQAGLLGRINALLGRSPKVDAAVLDELEEVMLTADLGVGLATRFLEDLRARLKKRELESADAVREALRDRLLAALAPEGDEPVVPDVFAAGGPQPKVILFVGVNGVGKTTSIGKIAAQLTGQGKKVLLAAGRYFSRCRRRAAGHLGRAHPQPRGARRGGLRPCQCDFQRHRCGQAKWRRRGARRHRGPLAYQDRVDGRDQEGAPRRQQGARQCAG